MIEHKWQLLHIWRNNTETERDRTHDSRVEHFSMLVRSYINKVSKINLYTCKWKWYSNKDGTVCLNNKKINMAVFRLKCYMSLCICASTKFQPILIHLRINILFRYWYQQEILIYMQKKKNWSLLLTWLLTNNSLLTQCKKDEINHCSFKHWELYQVYFNV